MAILKKYSDGYHKNGYYVHVSIPALDHPIPLQTPDITAKIYREAGYTAGDQVPDDLVWQLYNLDLHWTEEQGGIEVATEMNGGEGDLPPLSEDDLEEIRSFVKSYSGDYKTELDELVSRLEEKVDNRDSSDKQILDVVKGTPSIEPSESNFSFKYPTEVLIQEWVPEKVVSEATKEMLMEEYGKSFHFITPEEHRKQLKQIPNLDELLDQYAQHPWEVDSIFGTQEEEEQEKVTLKVRFDDVPGLESDSPSMTVTDHRRFSQGPDYKFYIRSVSIEVLRVNITEGYVSDFSLSPTVGPETRFDEVLADLASEIPDASKPHLLHSQTVLFVKALPAVFEFCETMDSYDLASVDIDTEYYEVTDEVVEKYLT